MAFFGDAFNHRVFYRQTIFKFNCHVFEIAVVISGAHDTGNDVTIRFFDSDFVQVVVGICENY
jgi:hypothetical protein